MAGVAESQLTAIRRSTYSGRPLGSQEFTRMLEKETKRRLFRLVLSRSFVLGRAHSSSLLQGCGFSDGWLVRLSRNSLSRNSRRESRSILICFCLALR
jgi:hypothetical protein